MLVHSPSDENFIAYRTSAYKLHLYETPSGYKLILLSDPLADSLRFVLRQVYAGPFLEYVVRNPLVTLDDREKGVDNDQVRKGASRGDMAQVAEGIAAHPVLTLVPICGRPIYA